MTEHEVRSILRQHVERAGSARALAAEWRLSQAYLDKQIRGAQAIGDKVLRRLKLIRRKTYEFYSADQRGVDQLGYDAGIRIKIHDEWREELRIGQREQGQGSPITPDQLSRIIGVTPRDIARLIRLGTDFPKPDARSNGMSAWKAETIYGWLRQKARKPPKK